MMFQKKIDRAMNWLKERNKSVNSSELNDFDPKAEWKAQESNKIELEKNDVLAIILSALIVFGPILLILIIMLILLFPSLRTPI
ncbi:hypothetical protein [Proteiniborus sp.]|uniref:hypothetical protein n=1 Tax=Proteiniborus sp. TaxID=2079015 RepID=UPI0033206AB4